MILLSHPTAARRARHAALALTRAGVLGEFWTCSQNGSIPRPCAISPFGAITPTNDRRPAQLATYCRSLDRSVSARLACQNFKGIYAYEDCAEESFHIAGLRGALRIYDVASAHWQAGQDICDEEAKLEPDWAATLPRTRHAATTNARRNSELYQADLVIVSSTFMMRTLEQLERLPGIVALMPPTPAAPRERQLPEARSESGSRKLRVLFAGDLTQRTGLSYVFRACRELREIVTLTVVGKCPARSCPALERELLNVRWIPTASADDLKAEMSAHDVFLAPSLFEDFDPTLLDAMAAGLPIIASAQTAAPDLIDHGFEGFIVPVRSADEIAARLELLWRDPERRAVMSANARRRALTHTWENYERALAASVATALARR
jgi:alpha-maltose-1-phosphate synthase